MTNLGQAKKTFADLLGGRFPYRGECLVETPESPMPDDIGGVIILEIKRNGRWKLIPELLEFDRGKIPAEKHEEPPAAGAMGPRPHSF